jgi:hypothetical protein
METYKQATNEELGNENTTRHQKTMNFQTILINLKKTYKIQKYVINYNTMNCFNF